MSRVVILPSAEIKTIAFDLGGVLAYQDLTVLTDEEKLLFDIYQKYAGKKRVSKDDREFLEYAKSRMLEITLKINKLNSETLAVLERLQSEKIRSSIWTNNTPYLNAWLEEVGILNFISLENVINSYYLGYDKPNRFFYINALEKIQTNASQVLFLDDSPKNLKGARNCGIECIQYNMDMDLKDTMDEVYEKARVRKLNDKLQKRKYEDEGWIVTSI